MSSFIIDSTLFRDQVGTAEMRQVFSDETMTFHTLELQHLFVDGQMRHRSGYRVATFLHCGFDTLNRGRRAFPPRKFGGRRAAGQ